MDIGQVEGLSHMACIYILQSEVNGTYYIGSTIDLARRLQEHEEGRTKYTRQIRPFRLAFTQEYETIEVARRIERKLKLLKNKNIIEKIIEEGLIKIK